MELDSVDKYIHLTPTANGTEIMFAGQPCLNIRKVVNTMEGSSSYDWNIYPVFAKLTYGASIFEDVPYCNTVFDTQEEAIADGLETLHSLGAFNKEIDLPTDTFANGWVNESSKKEIVLPQSVLKSILTDCRQYAARHSTSLIEEQDISSGLYKSIISEFANALVESSPFDWRSTNTEKKDKVEKRGRGKPTLGATVEEMKERMRENIAAGKRPHTGFDRNEKLRILRSGSMEHPEFAGTHVKSAGRPAGTTNAAGAGKKAAPPTVFSMWSGMADKK